MRGMRGVANKQGDIPTSAFNNKRQPVFWEPLYTGSHAQQNYQLRNVYNPTQYVPGFAYVPTRDCMPGYNFSDKMSRSMHLSNHAASTETWDSVGFRQRYNSTQFPGGYSTYAAKLQNSTISRCFCGRNVHNYGWNSGLMNQNLQQNRENRNRAPIVRNQTGSSLSQLTSPLSIDTSLEYEVSHSVSLPKDSAPLLLIQETSSTKNPGFNVGRVADDVADKGDQQSHVGRIGDDVTAKGGDQSHANNPSKARENFGPELSEIMGLNKENIENAGGMFGSHLQKQHGATIFRSNALKRKQTQDSSDFMAKRSSLLGASLHKSLTPPDLLSSSLKFFDTGTNICSDRSQIPPGVSQIPPGNSQIPPGNSQIPPGISQISPGNSQIPPGISQIPGTYKQSLSNYRETWAMHATPQWTWTNLSTPNLSTPHLSTPHLSTPHLATPHLTNPYVTNLFVC